MLLQLGHEPFRLETFLLFLFKNKLSCGLQPFPLNVIHDCLIKDKKTHEYLGCSRLEYIKWLESNTKGFTIDNYGKVWHIDHVIPLSKFDLTNKDDIELAFNWRNTMPLSAKENLTKNAKIVVSQIKEHYELLEKYHKDNNVPLPHKFVNLYARYLAAGNP